MYVESFFLCMLNFFLIGDWNGCSGQIAIKLVNCVFNYNHMKEFVYDLNDSADDDDCSIFCKIIGIL